MKPTQPIVYVSLFLGLLWIFLQYFEKANLYFPNTTLTSHPGTFGLPYKELSLAGGVHGWHIPGAPEAPLVILCHGNGGNISDRLEKAMILRKAGASVLLFDYRGYGKSPGSPDEPGTYADAQAAFDHAVRELKMPPSRIIWHGESLGGAVALELAVRTRCGGLILDSAFTSTIDMAAEVFPWLPGRLLVRNRYDNAAKIGSLHCPLLVLHSVQDDIVPFRMGRKLFDLAPAPKTLIELRGDHNGGFSLSGAVYSDAIRAFLNRVR